MSKGSLGAFLNEGFEKTEQGANPKSGIETISLNDIEIKQQVRKSFDEDKINELAQSIKSRGLDQPITVRKNIEGSDLPYVLVSGERRYRAYKANKEKRIPAIVRDIEVEAVDEVQLIENIQRENLTAYEIAVKLEELAKNYPKLGDLAKVIGKSQSYISKHLSILKAPEVVVGLYEDNILQNSQIAKMLSDIEQIDPRMFRKLCREARDTGKLTRAKAEDSLRKAKDKKLDADLSKGKEKESKRKPKSLDDQMREYNGEEPDTESTATIRLTCTVKVKGEEEEGVLILDEPPTKKNNVWVRLSTEIGQFPVSSIKLTGSK